jgi:hypothetical protein
LLVTKYTRIGSLTVPIKGPVLMCCTFLHAQSKEGIKNACRKNIWSHNEAAKISGRSYKIFIFQTLICSSSTTLFYCHNLFHVLKNIKNKKTMKGGRNEGVVLAQLQIKNIKIIEIIWFFLYNNIFLLENNKKNIVYIYFFLCVFFILFKGSFGYTT